MKKNVKPQVILCKTCKKQIGKIGRFPKKRDYWYCRTCKQAYSNDEVLMINEEDYN